MVGGGIMGYGMMGSPVGYFSFWGVFMWIIILVVIGLVLYFIVRSAKSGEVQMNTGYDTAMDILKKRYARG